MTPRPQTTPTALQYTALLEADVRRKGEQKGSVTRIGDSWHVRFFQWQQDQKGNLKWTRVQRLVGSASGPEALSLKQARKKAAAEHVHPANTRAKNPTAMCTVKDFIVARFQPDHIDSKKKATRIFYRTQLDNHVLPTLGDFCLGDVTPQTMQILIRAKADAKLSRQSLQHIRTVVSAVFKHARALGFYQGIIPTEGVKIPAAQQQVRRAMTPVVARLFVDAIPPPHRRMVALMLHTGMRLGETLGLRWRNVNLGDNLQDGIPPGCIRVIEQFTKGELTTIKTKSGNRIIPLTDEMAELLREVVAGAKFFGPDYPVFAGKFGQHLDGHNLLTRVIKPAAKSVGAPWINFHTTRHTNATLTDMELTGAEKKKVLGHASERMGLTYTHPEVEGVRTKMATSMAALVDKEKAKLAAAKVVTEVVQ